MKVGLLGTASLPLWHHAAIGQYRWCSNAQFIWGFNEAQTGILQELSTHPRILHRACPTIRQSVGQTTARCWSTEMNSHQTCCSSLFRWMIQGVLYWEELFSLCPEPAEVKRAILSSPPARSLAATTSRFVFFIAGASNNIWWFSLKRPKSKKGQEGDFLNWATNRVCDPTSGRKHEAKLCRPFRKIKLGEQQYVMYICKHTVAKLTGKSKHIQKSNQLLAEFRSKQCQPKSLGCYRCPGPKLNVPVLHFLGNFPLIYWIWWCCGHCSQEGPPLTWKTTTPCTPFPQNSFYRFKIHGL